MGRPLGPGDAAARAVRQDGWDDAGVDVRDLHAVGVPLGEVVDVLPGEDAGGDLCPGGLAAIHAEGLEAAEPKDGSRLRRGHADRLLVEQLDAGGDGLVVHGVLRVGPAAALSRGGVGGVDEPEQGGQQSEQDGVLTHG